VFPTHRDFFPWHLKVTVDAKDLAENGMPTPEESKVLFDVGDRIEKQSKLVGQNSRGRKK
jgi:hypothetical protein